MGEGREEGGGGVVGNGGGGVGKVGSNDGGGGSDGDRDDGVKRGRGGLKRGRVIVGVAVLGAGLLYLGADKGLETLVHWYVSVTGGR